VPDVVLVLMALVIGAWPLQASDPPTHCTRDERVVFSCEAPSRNVVSLCASRPKAAAALTYRYGPLDKPELVFPAAGAHPREHFRGSTVMYAGGGGAWLAFDRGGFTYFVYSAIGRDWEKEGVLVRKGDSQVADIRCAGAYKSDIGPELFEELDIPAGADEFDVPPEL
jgi:hypothetical protein